MRLYRRVLHCRECIERPQLIAALMDWSRDKRPHLPSSLVASSIVLWMGVDYVCYFRPSLNTRHRLFYFRRFVPSVYLLQKQKKKMLVDDLEITSGMVYSSTHIIAIFLFFVFSYSVTCSFIKFLPFIFLPASSSRLNGAWAWRRRPFATGHRPTATATSPSFAGCKS